MTTIEHKQRERMEFSEFIVVPLDGKHKGTIEYSGVTLFVVVD